MISINATLVVQIIHFLILVFVLNRLMLRPLMNQMQERDQYIVKARKDSEEMLVEAERLVEERHAMEMKTRRGAAQERAQLKEQAVAEAEGIFDETRREVAGIRERIDAEVQSQMEKAEQALNQEATALAEEIADKIAGRRISH
jgi:F-type H+-transporting ATPase subunit b